MKFKEFEEGLKLLQENGDCTVCFNDCHKGWCLSKFTRTWRINEGGKGCRTGHVSHEYVYENRAWEKDEFSMSRKEVWGFAL